MGFNSGFKGLKEAWTGEENLATTGIRSADRPTRSELGEEEA